MEVHQLKPGHRVSLRDGRGRPAGEAVVVGLRKIEDIPVGSYMLCLNSCALVRAQGWSHREGCYLVDLVPGRGDYGCSWPGEQFVLLRTTVG